MALTGTLLRLTCEPSVSGMEQLRVEALVRQATGRPRDVVQAFAPMRPNHPQLGLIQTVDDEERLVAAHELRVSRF